MIGGLHDEHGISRDAKVFCKGSMQPAKYTLPADYIIPILDDRSGKDGGGDEEKESNKTNGIESQTVISSGSSSSSSKSGNLSDSSNNSSPQ